MKLTAFGSIASALSVCIIACKEQASHVTPIPGAIVFVPWIKDDSTILYIDDSVSIANFNASWVFLNGFQGSEMCGYTYEAKRIDSTYHGNEFSLINMRCSTVAMNGMVYRNQMEPVHAALKSAKNGVFKLDTITEPIPSWIRKFCQNPDFIGYEVIDSADLYQICYADNEDEKVISKILQSLYPHNVIWDAPSINRRIAESEKFPLCINEIDSLRKHLDSAGIAYSSRKIGKRAYVYLRKPTQ